MVETEQGWNLVYFLGEATHWLRYNIGLRKTRFAEKWFFGPPFKIQHEISRPNGQEILFSDRHFFSLLYIPLLKTAWAYY